MGIVYQGGCHGLVTDVDPYDCVGRHGVEACGPMHEMCWGMER